MPDLPGFPTTAASASDSDIGAGPMFRAGPLDALTWGATLSRKDVTVHFAPAGVRLDGIVSEGFTAYERMRFQAALDDIAAVTDLTFTVTARRDADLRLVLDLNEMPWGYVAYFNPPSTFNAGVGVFDGGSWDRQAGGDLEDGGQGYVVVTHELLHGLGLAHPHDTGGGSSVMAGVSRDVGDYGDADLNQGVFTTMSYNIGYATGRNTDIVSRLYGAEIGPMALDIAVLQRLYGANTTHAAGDDTYGLPRDNGPGTGWRAVWDTGGTDTMRYDGWRDATLDLRAARLDTAPGGGGFVSAAAEIRGGLTIAAGVVIEVARGGGGDDRIIGNGAANHLFGNGGDDLVRGRRGGDVLHGGVGDDILSGGRGADRLHGGGGADVLRGGRGADMLTGGDGADRFDFNAARHSRAGHMDTICDFDAGRDVIDLTDIDADRTLAGHQSFDVIGTRDFGAAGHLRMTVQGDDLRIAADRDGDGRADMAILVLNSGLLDAGDILL